MHQTNRPSQGAGERHLGRWLRGQAQRQADAVALESPDGEPLTYSELAAAVLARARAFAEAGLQSGERIAVAATRSTDTVISILAAVEAGIAYVPLDLAYPAERLRAMLDDAQPRAVVGDAEALSTLRALVGELPTLAQPSPVLAPLHASAPDLTYVLFTSGSTGRPKGVAMGAVPLDHLIQWHADHPRLGQSARTLQFAPLSFDVHFQEIFSTLACGGTLVLVPEDQRRDPALLLNALIQRRIERIFVPYVALQMIAEAAREELPAALRDVVSAGEQLQVTPAIRSLFQRLPGSELHNHYGPTESHVVTAHELRGDPADWPEIPPIGRALPHVQLALVASGNATDEHTGELLLGGETLAWGYLGRPELTGERFRADFPGLPGRWYVTGDLARRDADGIHTYLGRADQQLKVDGFRIEPGEIELAIMAQAGIKDAVVTAPELPGIGKQLVAHLVLREGAPENTSELISRLRAELRAAMPEYMVPVRYVVLDRLPTTPSGKIDRKGLPLPAMDTTAPASSDPVAIVRGLWQELLGLPSIGDDQNLFDLGARSLLVMRFVTRLKDQGVKGLNVADVYDKPTVAGIAAALAGPVSAGQRKRLAPTQPTAGIAIVGMATRTPGARRLDDFWQNLIDGREGIRQFSLDELDPSVPPSVRSRPNFVAAHGVLDGVEHFDAGFFGISAREATMLDPQQRLMLELSVAALEHAAIDASRTDARIGVYAGTGNNAYAPALRSEQPELVQQYGEFATMLASEKDYVATRVANRLNLNGPALSIHTACSTSLVAVAQAWHALASGQCDVALAGGINVAVPQISGYLHVEGGMESADGHCRPFDADASGTVFASGGGVVVLRRLEDALANGDTVYAVIRGVGLNNDGGDKASFTAPSVTGQMGAIRMALDQAGVSARQIGYVEAHGTGTSLGDPIEVAALTRAWREDTADSQYCGIGSVKSNLGHMAAGAGVVGLIKAALSLHHGVIPGTLHYRQPNPQIDFESTPFRVVAQNTPWPRGGDPRLAAVSSFGVGGTNAHVVIEEAPARPPLAASEGRWLLPLSARTSDAALQRARDLAEHLEQHPELALSEVAATLMRGRKPMAQRLTVVAGSVQEAIARLRAAKSSVGALQMPRLVFLFPGQGSQHPGMARQLVDEVPAFREALDRALPLAEAALGVDLRAWLVAADPADAEVAKLLAQTRYAQPALFSVSYALAAWLDSLGIQPDAMIGHSIGEYAAACHAGVFSLEDAMAAVIARGQAMFDQPAGAMLAVRTGVDAVQALLPEGIEIAGCNAPALTVVAGGHEAIDRFALALEKSEIDATRLRVSHAFHSASMEGALPRVAQALAQARLQAPRLTVYSCVSGAPLQAHEATDPGYWARQVRAPVLFSKAVMAELAQGETVFVEVGPGQALTALLRQHRTPKAEVPRIVPMLGAAQDPGQPAEQGLSALGALWCAGIDPAWPVAATARRAPLPTYPFQNDRHWFARRTAPAGALLSDVPLPVASAVTMSRIPTVENELKRVLSDVSGIPADDMTTDASFVDQGLDSLSLTQATLELERVFGVKLRFRRLMEDLDNIGKLARFLDTEMPAGKFAPVAPVAAPAVAAAAIPAQLASFAAPAAPLQPFAALPGGTNAVHQLLQQQMQLMAQQLAVLAGQPMAAALPVAPPPAMPTPALAAPAPSTAATEPEPEPAQPSIKSLVEKPFGASPRLTLEARQDFTPAQRRWLDEFITRYNARSGKSKAFSQQHRKVMADPRVVTGFNPLYKDLVYPIVVDRSQGASLWDLDGNEYIDLLSCFGGNLLGYQPPKVIEAMQQQLQLGLEVGPQHPYAADVAQLISEFTGMERVGFCNTGSEAVMGAMRIARTVTGRKTIAIFTNSYHGIFDEVIVRGTRQLRSLSAAPGILANAVENILVLDWNSEDSLRVLRERGPELAAIMTEPIQNKYPTLQPREFVQSLRQIADKAGCALIFDEVVTGFRVAPGGAQEFYGVRADIATYGKVIGGGLPFAAIAGNANWLDALDGGHWQYGDDSYPEAGVTYFAGTFVRHPLALAAARATLQHIKAGGREFYRNLNDRTQRLIDRLNTAFSVRGAPVKAVHCASIWRLQWDDNQKHISLFYYLVRYHGLHLYEQFGHFVTEGMTDAHTDRIFQVFTDAMDELMGLGFITPKDGSPPPPGPQGGTRAGTDAQLSPGQTERWLAGGFDPSARLALNESFCVSLQGGVDRAALKAALDDVLTRHEAFRIHFDLEEPRQRVAPQLDLPVAEIDLSQQPDADRALDDFCTQASLRDFPLDQAPLAAVSLLTLADGRTVVHVVASHLVFDGWASSVFNAELATAYKARSMGMAPAFKPAESPLDFAEEEQARFDGPDGQEALRFWQQQLHNPPAPLNLGDRTPHGHRTYAADTLRIRLDGELFSRLRVQAKLSGATLFQVLLTAVTRMLAKCSDQTDFVVSIPYASQSLQRRGPIMADGVLDLPLRLGCQPGESTETVLQRVRSRLMDALEYPLMTQGTVARALGIRSAGDRPPLTGIYFNLNPKVDLSAYAPLHASMHEGRKRGTLSELFFNFYEQNDALTLDLHYSSEYFSPQRAQALIDALLSEIAHFAQHADGKLPVLTSVVPPPAASPRQAPTVDPRLIDWNNATTTPQEPHARVEQWIVRQADATPDAVALLVHGVSVSYAALESRANRFGQLLRSRGIGAGMLVGVCLNRGPDLVPALLGILKTGAAYVPLDPGFPKDRLHYMAKDANLRLVITDAANAPLSGLPRERQIRIDDDASVIASAPNSALPRQSDWADNATMYVIYTSGSTGNPKGVVLPQNAVCNFLASMRRKPGLHADDRLLAVTTLSFDIAVLEIFLPLTTGATVVLAQREDAMDPEALARLVTEQRINVMQATPTTWHMLLDAGWQAPAGFRALCGGEPLPPTLAERLLSAGVELWNMYGPTETTVWSTVCRITDAKQKITIGHPIDNTQVWVLDDEMKPCAIGQEGELCIGGAGVATGYFNRPELTAEKFIADPFDTTQGARIYRTGDLARWREDGTLEHLGRLDFQIKIRGYRIELGEIEARLAALPGIARTVVTAREDSPGDVRLVGYAVPHAGQQPNIAALRDALRADLPAYMVPQNIVLLDSMPLLPNGKIDRKALPNPRQTKAPAPPATNSVKTEDVARAMAQMLGHDTVRPEDNFFELGGHSLLAAKLARQLGQQFECRMTIKSIFDAPTPWLLAEALGRARSVSPALLSELDIPARPDQSSAPLSPMQERLWFMENLHPRTPVNHLPSAHRLRGVLDIDAFQRAFQRLVDRQPSLRTSFRRQGRDVVQSVASSLVVRFPSLITLDNVPASEREAHVGEWLREATLKPFELDQAPLFRIQLLRLNENDHVLYFMVHHLIWDGASFDIFYREIDALYTAELEGRPDPLPPLKITYGDFAAWIQHRMAGGELKRQIAYWQEKLTPMPAPLALPADRERPTRMSGSGASFKALIPNEEIASVQAFAERQGTTLSTILLSTFALLLHRHSGQDDLVIGLPVRGREQAALEPIMGFFVNALPMRLQLPPSTTVRAWLGQVQAVLSEALSCPDVPYEHLSRTLHLTRDESRAAIFQTLFSYQDARERPTRWGTLEHTRFDTAIHGATQDISLWNVLIGKGLECSWTYNTDIFDLDTIRSLAQRFRQLLLAMCAQGDLALAKVDQDPSQSASAAGANTGSRSTEQYLTSLWQDLLQLTDVDTDTRFLDLGGHSILVMRMATAIEADLGMRVPLNAIFTNETIRTLAAWIDIHGVKSERAKPQIDESIDALAEDAPLTLMQQRVWFVETLSPGSATYHIPSASRLRGTLNLGALNQAFGALVDMHPSLRTQFLLDATGVPRQRVIESIHPDPLTVEDLTAPNKAALEERLLVRIAELTRKPFDLAAPMLWRACVLRLTPQEHVLFFMTHHLISDGASMQMATLDLAELYRAFLQQEAPRLEQPGTTYARFAHEHRARVDAGAMDEQVAHWQTLLTPAPEPLALPCDHPRPAKPTNKAGHVLLEIPPSSVQELQALARECRATLFMVSLAAYVCFLYRHSGQTDFVIGIPSKGRPHAEHERVFGFFSNVLPLRISIEGNGTFRELLIHVQNAVLNSFDHPDVPIEQVIRNLRLARDESRSPLYQTLFGFQEVPSAIESFGDLKRESVYAPVEGIAEDITVWMWNASYGIKAFLTYSTDLFAPATAQRFADRFTYLLKTAASQADQPISELRIEEEDSRQLLASLNATETTYPKEATIHGLLSAQATRTPDATAIVQTNLDGVDYAGLETRANRLSRALRSRGIRRGDLVGLCVERSIDMVICQLAILKAGAAYVPLDPAYPTDRLAYMAQDAQLALLLTESSLVHAIDWPRARALLIDIDVASITSQSDAPLPTDPALDARPEDPAYVIYTSGSTGKPKGVVVQHRAVVNFLCSMAREPGLSSSDVLLAVTTLSFDIAVLELLLPLSMGARVILATREQVMDGMALRELMEDEGVTVMQATPSTWRMLIDAGWQGSSSFKALIGGEGLPQDLAAQLLERTGELWNMYGPTETTVWSTCWRVVRPENGISIGRPIANTTIHILDERQQLCPIGVPGEIYIGGDGVTLGYLRRPELTAERFISDPFSPGARLYRTGDRGRWRHNGLLEHQGRLDFQVKVRGHRIELGEIESQLATHPSVSRTVVIVREDTPGDQRLVAYVVPNGQMPEAQVLREQLRSSLPEYMVPQYFVPLQSIPLLPNGKTDRNSLPKPQSTAHGPAQRILQPPSTPTEIAVAAVWQRLLGIETVNTSDNFFDLGGHSLLAMRAVTEINKLPGINLTVRQLIFENLGQIASRDTALPSITPSAPDQNDPVSLAGADKDSEPPRGFMRRLLNKLSH